MHKNESVINGKAQSKFFEERTNPIYISMNTVLYPAILQKNNLI